jgi:(S)-ureidoglycine aminohydrolase
MHNLGNTRSSQQRNHLLLTPDTFVRTTLPGMKGCAAVVHAGPALGAGFTEYTAEFEAGGELLGTPAQRFIFVMEGTVKLETPDEQSKLGVGGYAYIPAALTHRVTAAQQSRVAVIEKSYEPLAGAAPPHLIVSHEDNVASHPLDDDPSLQV